MKPHTTQMVLLACLWSTALVAGLPVAESNKEIDVLSVPLNNGQELDVLTFGNEQALTDRNKRTIGILRQLFPELSKQVDEQVNKIIAPIIRALGPTILRTAIQGNQGGGGASSARDDFDADFDDDDDDTSKTSSGGDDTGTRVQIELPTFSPEDNDEDNETDSDKSNTSTSTESRKRK